MWFVYLFFRLWVKASAAIYAGEGINVPLMFMPTRLIGLTLRNYGARIGDDVRFQSPVVIHNSERASGRYYENLQVGSHCFFGRELFLDLQDRIVVEDYVTISHRVTILTHTDAGTSPLKDKIIPTSNAPVTIRTGAYIGANVTILQGMEIGQSSIVGAGAVVTRSVPASTVVVGVPARVIKSSMESRARSTTNDMELRDQVSADSR
ncbi:MAG TPA: acyltransferase [Pyrinomonadaceae bacterium]|nr:acyltransferase [Pyrinomonadaceae bacterium]